MVNTFLEWRLSKVLLPQSSSCSVLEKNPAKQILFLAAKPEKYSITPTNATDAEIPSSSSAIGTTVRKSVLSVTHYALQCRALSAERVK